MLFLFRQRKITYLKTSIPSPPQPVHKTDTRYKMPGEKEAHSTYDEENIHVSAEKSSRANKDYSSTKSKGKRDKRINKIEMN